MLTSIYSANPCSHLKNYIRVNSVTRVSTISLTRFWFFKFRIRKVYVIGWPNLDVLISTQPLFSRTRPNSFWSLTGLQSPASRLNELIAITVRRNHDV
jgi:hypothetical protein